MDDSNQQYWNDPNEEASEAWREFIELQNDPEYWGEMEKEREEVIQSIKEFYSSWLSVGGTEQEFFSLINQSPIHKTSNHFLFPNPEDRKREVMQYRKDKKTGKAESQEAWANNRGYSGRVLRSYLREFPENI